MAENKSNFPAVFRQATAQDRADVISLWKACGLTRPWNDPGRDFDMALDGPASDVLVAVEDGDLMASLMVGHDGHRGTVYYVSVRPALQHSGLGRALMREAEAWVRARGIPKINLIVRGDNKTAIGFYEALGYGVEPNVQLGRRLD